MLAALPPALTSLELHRVIFKGDRGDDDPRFTYTRSSNYNAASAATKEARRGWSSETRRWARLAALRRLVVAGMEQEREGSYRFPAHLSLLTALQHLSFEVRGALASSCFYLTCLAAPASTYWQSAQPWDGML